MTNDETPWWWWVVCLMTALAMTVLMHSCSPQKVVTEHHYEEKNNSTVYRDSVYQRDSIFTFIKGDTIRLVETHYVYRVTNNTDSVYVIKKDSIPYAVPAELSKSQKARLDAWGYLVGAVFVLLAIIVLLVRFLWKGRSTLF